MDLALGISTIIFTASLVLVTGFYALQTRHMVKEMHSARGANIRPNVSLHVRHIGGGAAFVILENTGVGPAMDVEVMLNYGPDGPGHRWSTSVMPIGEQARFFVRDLVQDYDSVVLEGTCRDALGEPVAIAGEVRLKESWELSTQAQLVLEDDPAAKSATELERIRKSLDNLTAALEKRNARAVHRRPAKAETPETPATPVEFPAAARQPRARRGRATR